MDASDRELVAELIEHRVMSQMREQRRWIIGTIIAATATSIAVASHLESDNKNNEIVVHANLTETIQELRDVVRELQKPGSDDPAIQELRDVVRELQKPGSDDPPEDTEEGASS